MPKTIEMALHDDLITGRELDLGQTVLVFGLAEHKELGRKALAKAVWSWRRLKIKPSTVIMLLVSGYDEDPRELWQIPEVCAFVQKFCAKTDAHKHPALEPSSRALLYACGADPAVRVNVNMISAEEHDRRFKEFAAETLKRDDT